MYLRLFMLMSAVTAAATAADVRVVEEIVAKVNGDIITRGEIEETRQSILAQLKRDGVNGARLQEAMKQQERDALREQIDQLLLVQKGKDLNINVDPEVTRQLAEIQVQSKIDDPDKFHEWIREQTGKSYEDFRQDWKNRALTRRVIGQEIGSRIAIPEADKRKYFEEHKKDFVREEQVFLRQIVISTEGKSPEQVAAAEKKAKDVAARAKRGEKFNELARDFSDDPETSKSGGELPPYKRGMLRKEIEDIVFKQNKGFVTDPIRVPAGFVIFRVEDRWAPGQASYEEVEPEITERLSAPLMEPKIRTFLTKLRQDAFLEIRAGYVDSGAAPGKDTSWKDPAQLKPETTTKEEVVAASKNKRRLLWVIPIPSSRKAKKDKIEGSQPAAAAAVPAKP